MRVLVLCSAALVAWLQAAPPQAPPPPPPRPPSIPGTSRGRPSLPPASPQASRPSPQRVRSATGDALDRYSRGEFERAIAVLLTVGGFELSHARTWVLAASSPEELERRRLTAALVALEFTAARSLLSSVHYEWAAAMLRERPQPASASHPPVVAPHAAEGLWLRASVALAEGRKAWTLLTSEPVAASAAGAADGLPSFAGHLSYARARAPDDPFFRIAEAVGLEIASSHVPDMLFSVSSADVRHRDRIEADVVDASPAGARRAEKLAAAVALLEPLASDPRVAGEAHLRLGYVALRRGEQDRALAHLDAVNGATSEDFARFLAHLFAGWTHARHGRTDDAVARYRAALAIVPRARSAATLLTATLTSAGRLADAERVVDEFLSRPPDSGDPWDWYLLGDYRHYQRLINQMRGMVTGTTGTRNELTYVNLFPRFGRRATRATRADEGHGGDGYTAGASVRRPEKRVDKQ